MDKELTSRRKCVKGTSFFHDLKYTTIAYRIRCAWYYGRLGQRQQILRCFFMSVSVHINSNIHPIERELWHFYIYMLLLCATCIQTKWALRLTPIGTRGDEDNQLNHMTIYYLFYPEQQGLQFRVGPDSLIFPVNEFHSQANPLNRGPMGVQFHIIADSLRFRVPTRDWPKVRFKLTILLPISI